MKIESKFTKAIKFVRSLEYSKYTWGLFYWTPVDIRRLWNKWENMLICLSSWWKTPHPWKCDSKRCIYDILEKVHPIFIMFILGNGWVEKILLRYSWKNNNSIERWYYHPLKTKQKLPDYSLTKKVHGKDKILW